MLLCMVLLLTVTTASPAQEAGNLRLLENVFLEGAERMTTDSFLNLITLRPGQLYDDNMVRREFQAVWESQLFDDLWIEERDGASGGKILVFHVQERPTVTQVTYEGLKRITKSDITEKLEEIGALVLPGTVLNYEKIKKAEALIRYAGQEKGYAEATVQTEITPISRSQVEVTFFVDEGPKTRIKQVTFEGNTVFSDRQLKGLMKNTRSSWFMSWITRKNIYSESRYSEDVNAVREAYEELGYLDVLVDDPVITTTTESGDKPKIWYDMVINIDEGPQYNLGAVNFTGNTVFDSDRLIESLPLKEGKPLNKVLLTSYLRSIETGYGARGYIYATAGPVFNRNPEQGVADVTINIREDQEYYINRIEFVGNYATRDKVLRRELRIKEQALFNQAAYRLGLYKLKQLGFFRVEGDPVITPLPGTNKVDITVEGLESEKNELLFGGGYSGLNGFFGSFSFKTRNFLGMGKTLQLSANIGARQSLFDVRYFDTWFLDTRFGFGASVFARETEFIDFDQRSLGGNVTLSRALGNFQSARVTLAVDNSKVKDVDGLAGILQSPFLDAQNRNVTSLIPAYTYNSTNHPYRPNRGLEVGASLEWATSSLGGDTDFMKGHFSASWFRPTFKKQHFGLHLEAGHIKPLNGDSIPIYERYFLGGESNLRVFDQRSVRPRTDDGRFFIDPQTGLIEGGDTLFLLNFEYVWRINDSMDLIGFYDAGNVYHEREKADLGDLRMDAGVELRFFLPVFNAPLRLIYGINLDPVDDESSSNFAFSVGTTF